VAFVGEDLPRRGMNEREAFDFIAERLDAIGELFAGREDFEMVEF